ncbi:ESX-1 secretion-associated protein EspC [Mycobacterium basiliense]|uniref:ESX-1 secretion-associated protein EspC n=1 Tax=Mycobacterium basiliense TaxID=2094119 RepID=A0A447GD19_9MYCO|nr:ESX-1 secretion-associated protein [Mycobacterium basiliense]VDM88345.1 ESX-1 secretion-associated protein EspC [Mycobacterium basiliense]
MTANLKVEPEFLGVLASHHDNAAADATSATESAAGLSDSVTVTHGSYCKQFNTALQMYENTRNTLGSSLHTAGIDLANSLRSAARAYLEADETWSTTLSSLFS